MNFLANPRNEDAENELDVTNNKFMNFLGDMISLDSQEGLFEEVQVSSKIFLRNCIKIVISVRSKVVFCLFEDVQVRNKVWWISSAYVN